MKFTTLYMYNLYTTKLFKGLFHRFTGVRILVALDQHESYYQYQNKCRNPSYAHKKGQRSHDHAATPDQRDRYLTSASS